MSDRKAFVLFAAILWVAFAGVAHAQTSTTGAVRGVISDAESGEPVAGATVVVRGPALQGQQAVLTDSEGTYRITSLPPGTYVLTVYIGELQFSRPNVLIRLGGTAMVPVEIDTGAAAGEVIELEGRAPLIDQDSTKTGVTITEEYTQNIPTGRTFGAVLGAAAGNQGDLLGVSFQGSSSLENQFIIDGLNVTDPAFGGQGTNLPNEFIRETEVITGGYNAEYGRSSGGIVNVITKSGSNEFRGSIFAYLTPGPLVAPSRGIHVEGSVIERDNNLAYSADVGAEVGGPIIEDRLWFHAGLNPTLSSTNVSRIINSLVDSNDDGQPDVDEDGFTVYREVGRTERSQGAQTYYFTGKLTGAVSPEHQGQLSLIGRPRFGDRYLSVTGAESAGLINLDEQLYDASARWTSKFFDNRTEVDVLAGYHWDQRNQSPAFAGGGGSQVLYGVPRSLASFAEHEQAFGGVPAACDDGNPNDPNPNLAVNCPVQNYRVGGLGFLQDRTTSRAVATASVTQRVRALGHHNLKAGLDFENQTFDTVREYTGGTWYYLQPGNIWQLRRFYSPEVGGERACGLGAECAHQERLAADTTTRNVGAYAQDSWAIVPNVTVNAGLRWERQQLFNSKQMQGVTSPLTGQQIPRTAFTLNNMLAPRVGAIYDWTEEGRSKVYGHYGRFYHSIPMQINVRSFGGEMLGVRYLPSGPSGCPSGDPVGNCNEEAPLADQLFGEGDTNVVPDIGAQYLDEFGFGAEYELLADLVVGAEYKRRSLGRIIEDLSFDRGDNYLFANPGEAVDPAEIERMREEAERLRAEGEDALAAFTEKAADDFAAVALYDRPIRRYEGITLRAEQRFTRNLMGQVSYTYARLTGNFPGLFSPETGQTDPNLTSMYDLLEMMPNRYGRLASDHPHQFKVDGFYRHHWDGVGQLTFGARARATSGRPRNHLGAHTLYGRREAYVLPRGAGGRTQFTHRLDTHVSYGRELREGTVLSAFVDVFNVYNYQPELLIDEEYTFSPVHPIVGGDEDDLAHLKALDPATGLPIRDGQGRGVAAVPNPNYGNTIARQAPLSVRFGMRLTF